MRKGEWEKGRKGEREKEFPSCASVSPCLCVLKF